MASFICEKQGRCCPYEFYDSIEQPITDSEDGVPCDHLIEVAQVNHGRWKRYGKNLGECSECGEIVSVRSNYCPNCGAKMKG